MAIKRVGGRWRIDFRFGGKRVRETFDTHKDAKERLDKVEAAIIEGRYFPERRSSQRFSDFAAKFWTLHLSKLRSPWWGRLDDAGYWHGMMALWVAEFRERKLSEIRTEEVQAVYDRLIAEHKPGTANRYFTLLRLAYNKAARWGDFGGVNPCRGVDVRREDEFARTRYLTEPEIAAFLRCCHPRLAPLVYAALATGLRRGELFALQWTDVDFMAGTLTIRQSKSGRPRTIPMPGRLRDMLLAMGPRDGSVFELPRVMFYRYFNRARKDSGLPHFTFHDLRRTFGSHFTMRTKDLPTLGHILGHLTPKTTLRYARFAQEHVAQKMEAGQVAIPFVPAALPAPAPEPATAPDGHFLDTPADAPTAHAGII